ncbi:MAG: D-alanine--D-alanine ligase [Albimonas sp.]|uniref:D-alanine--D-alanine ligase n=1 Tax=Albimonas sp. TaxID=1872425 RepID=UPI00405709D8
MSGRASTRVAVLLGGRSAEREVSLVSGAECAAALRTAGYSVIEIDAGPDLVQRLADASPDVVFNALHGRWGEDGCVQGLLEWLGIPYTHSGVLASSVAMDKVKAKEVFAAAGLPVAEGRLVAKAEAAAGHPLPPPYVLKPYNEGSSVGVYIVSEGANGPAKLAPDAPDLLLAETFVPGREMTVAVMGDRALAVTDIRAASGGWYDYAAKYSAGGSLHVVPAEIPAEVEAACRDIAVRAHRALGCRGLSRSDFRWDESKGVEGLILLEVNTQPGMTPTSLAPEQAAHAGISFPDLCAWLVEDASCLR